MSWTVGVQCWKKSILGEGNMNFGARSRDTEKTKSLSASGTLKVESEGEKDTDIPSNRLSFDSDLLSFFPFNKLEMSILR